MRFLLASSPLLRSGPHSIHGRWALWMIIPKISADFVPVESRSEIRGLRSQGAAAMSTRGARRLRVGNPNASQYAANNRRDRENPGCHGLENKGDFLANQNGHGLRSNAVAIFLTEGRGPTVKADESRHFAIRFHKSKSH